MKGVHAMKADDTQVQQPGGGSEPSLSAPGAAAGSTGQSSSSGGECGQPFATDLQSNLQSLKNAFGQYAGLTFHAFQIRDTDAMLIFDPTVCDTDALDRLVLIPLLERYPVDRKIEIDQLRSVVPVSKSAFLATVQQAVNAIASGQPVLLIDGEARAAAYGLQQYEHRNVDEPSAESTIRGPREGFTENIGINLSLIRKRLKNPALNVWRATLGTATATSVAVVYLEGVADPDVIKTVQERITRMETDRILESSYIEEQIIESPYSPFPQLVNTERPDVVCANLLEGKFAILTDGTPFALIAPVTFFSMLQSAEDYYQHFLMSTFIRWLRYAFYFISLLLPSFYIAITTYHQEMIPTVLLLSIAKAREEIPFPALIEALIMELVFEALREAGIRLPKQVGAAVSIVGALIIGQAATSAGIVSAPMVIVVAATGIASFMIPRYSAGIASRLLRFPIMIMSGTMGLIGLMLSLILIIVHLSGLRSFGTPYFSPLAPASGGLLRDVLWRAPQNITARGRKTANAPEDKEQTDHV